MVRFLDMLWFLVVGFCLIHVPLLALGGLFNTLRPAVDRIVHAAMILAAYVMGMFLLGMVLDA